MAKDDYMPTEDFKKAELFIHVRETLPDLLAVMNLLPLSPANSTEINRQAADAAAFDYQCRAQRTLVAAAQESTSAKNRLRDGDPANPNAPVSLAFPLSPGSVPSPVPPGVVLRFRKFVRWLKGLNGYTEDIGKALRIVGEEQAAPDFAAAKPVLPLSLDGGRPYIDWGWGGMAGFLDSCEIHVDRGDGAGFVFLTIDSRPGYLDSSPLPSAPARWKYKAIYRKDDVRTGLWSDVAEIFVG